MKTTKLLTLVLFVLFSANNLSAQRPVLTDEEQVSEMVTKEIDEVFHSEDFLKKKNKKFAEVKGYMVIDVGVIQNGKVSTFFKVDSDIKNIDFINFIVYFFYVYFIDFMYIFLF